MRPVQSIALFVLAIFLGCPAKETRPVVVATTTSLDNSGLLRIVASEFERDTGIALRTIVVGTGKALRLAEKGDVHVTLTHHQGAETAFVKSGRAKRYRQFAWNEFVIVGPQKDPAGIRQSSSAAEAFRRIHQTRAPFCARNDESGTAMREAEIWRGASIDPSSNPNFKPLGQSMAALLRSSNELGAYALTDSATFDQLSRHLDLIVLYRGDHRLRNTYAVISTRQADRNADRFVEWLLSPRGRGVVEGFRIHGRPQFQWIALKE